MTIPTDPYRDIEDLEEFEAPWRKMVRLQDVGYPGGVRYLRVRIREGRRITDLELAPETAEHLGKALLAWAGIRGDGSPGEGG